MAKKLPKWITLQLRRATAERIHLLDKLYMQGMATTDGKNERRRARRAWKKYELLRDAYIKPRKAVAHG